jgi:hypothetical protein
VRLHESNVTYWWRRVPDTAYTLVAVVPDVPAPAGGRAAVPHLRRPPRCAAGGAAPGCLAAAEAVYHRLDLRSGADAPLR